MPFAVLQNFDGVLQKIHLAVELSNLQVRSLTIQEETVRVQGVINTTKCVMLFSFFLSLFLPFTFRFASVCPGGMSGNLTFSPSFMIAFMVSSSRGRVIVSSSSSLMIPMLSPCGCCRGYYFY